MKRRKFFKTLLGGLAAVAVVGNIKSEPINNGEAPLFKLLREQKPKPSPGKVEWTKRFQGARKQHAIDMEKAFLFGQRGYHIGDVVKLDDAIGLITDKKNTMGINIYVVQFIKPHTLLPLTLTETGMRRATVIGTRYDG